MMLPNSPARYIGYARLSEASEASTSIARQHEIITQTVAARGGQLVDIVDDPEASATRLRLDRPGLSEVRRRALLASRIAAVEVAPVPPKQRAKRFQPERLTVVTWPDSPDADDE